MSNLRLITLSVVITLATGSWDEKMYFAPVEVLTGWSDLDPGAINCQSSGGRRPVTAAIKREDTALVWNGHATEPVSGYSCMLVTLTTRCNKGFFGGEDLIYETSYRPPPPSRCRDEYVGYLNQHEQILEHPPPDCRWNSMKDSVREVVKILPTVMEYDPFRDEYVDHKLKSGVCVSGPCPLLKEMGLWFNTTSPVDACEFEDPVEVTIGTTSSSTNHPGNAELSSLSLMARSFEGACVHQMCSMEGYRLSTGEWIRLSANNITDLPDCLNDTLTMNTLTREGLVNHAIGAYAVSEESRRCLETKEKLMAGAPVSRSEMSALQPQVVGKQPVYMYNGEKWQVASAQYDLVVYPRDRHAALSTGTLGVLHNTTRKIIWQFPNTVNHDLVDGPNGIYWYRGILRNPRIWEAHSTELFNVSKGEYRRTSFTPVRPGTGFSPMDLSVDMVRDIPMSILVKTGWGIGLAAVGALVLIVYLYRCLCGPGSKYGKPSAMPLTVF